jgi:hypothetical protein
MGAFLPEFSALLVPKGDGDICGVGCWKNGVGINGLSGQSEKGDILHVMSLVRPRSLTLENLQGCMAKKKAVERRWACWIALGSLSLVAEKNK